MDSFTDEDGYEGNFIKGGTRLPTFIRPNNPAEVQLFKYSQHQFVHQVIKIVSGFERVFGKSPPLPADMSGYSVLVLHHLSKWAMFITQAIIRELFPSFTVISVGPNADLRLVICDQLLLQRKIMKDLVVAMNVTNVTNANSDPVDHGPHGENSQGEFNCDTDLCGGSVSVLSSSTISSLDPSLTGRSIVKGPLEQDEEMLTACQPLPDENWTRLLPIHLSDILESVGSVWVVKGDCSKMEGVTDICPNFDSGELDHVLELYDFPPSLVTSDLNQIFQEFEPRGFTIFWTDDTHAVIRFSSKEVATMALDSMDPGLLKCRPMSCASRQTKLMLARCYEKRLPYKRRPVTESNTAKRLILQSLGIRKDPPGRGSAPEKTNVS